MPTSNFDPTLSHILVVDDDRTARALIRRFLESEGFNVAEASDGQGALDQLHQRSFDLVMMDIVMPGLDGRTACARIHDLFPEPPPVLFMTALDFDAEVGRLYDAGGVDYVRKPIAWPILHNRIRYIIKAHRANRERQLLTQKYEMILETVDNGISGFNSEGRVNYMNPAALRLLGYEEEETLGRHCRDIFRIARAGSASFGENCIPFLDSGNKDSVAHFDEVRMERRDGTTFLADLRAKPFFQDGRLTGGVVVFQDITERQKAAQIIRHMANHDALTNLPNRNYLVQRLPQAVSLANRQERHLFLLFIDLDRFKPINDRYGHDVGDEVLVQVGRRLTGAMRASDAVCRLGGDEFVILLESVAGLHGAIMVAERAIQLLNEPIRLKELECEIGASIGIADFPGDSDNAEELLRHADQAMYAAKKKGRNCWHLYGDQIRVTEAG